MTTQNFSFDATLDIDFKKYHELMLHRVHEILLVSSPYDAYILEEDGSLASRIIHEYHGLNLSKPPRLTSISLGGDALILIAKKKFDLVISTPYVGDMDAYTLAEKIKLIRPKVPVILLTSSLQYAAPTAEISSSKAIDNLYLWSGNTDLLLAIIKNIEDHFNAPLDTKTAMVRILILVEDSPIFRSSILPILYKEVVRQTHTVLDESLNEEHRLLKMRARPKILLASSYEQALQLFQQYDEYVFAVMSDTRFEKGGEITEDAGIQLLNFIRATQPDLPLLLLSSNPMNREPGKKIPAAFLDKNDSDFLNKIRSFFLTNLGFGDFVFRLPNGKEVGRAANFHAFEKKITEIPDQSLIFHAERNHFSTWIMARSEIGLASMMARTSLADFDNIDEVRSFLANSFHSLRKWRQKGVVVSFSIDEFDAEVMDIVKIGKGSLGGKARGIAFMNSLIHHHNLLKKFKDVSIKIPKTCVISADGFNSFIEKNKLFYLCGGTDDIIIKRFLDAELPGWLRNILHSFLNQVRYPLAVRSSSLLEDALFVPYAGLYQTCMLPNIHKNAETRLYQLESAIKLVYASCYFEEPRAFSRSITQNRQDSMAVIIQQITGRPHGNYYYPAISGVVQSYNSYPISYMKPTDGIAHIALGFGKTVVEGEQNLRFSPKYPTMIPQFSSVDDTLKNAQKYFYALDRSPDSHLDLLTNDNLIRREICNAEAEYPVQTLTSTYIAEEHRIRDYAPHGPKIATFAKILKYNIFPLCDILSEFIEIGRKAMGCQIEIEFSANLATDKEKHEFNFLQIRPMVTGEELFEVNISSEDKENCFCYASEALGHGKTTNYRDIIYVKTDCFDPAQTTQMAKEIALFNAQLLTTGSKYLLIGPGRWGTADPILGIPVKWHNISAVGAIIELRNKNINSDPSQGTHFFQNITSLGIPYLTVVEKKSSKDRLNWQWLKRQKTAGETKFIKHVTLDNPLIIKCNGRRSECVVLAIPGDITKCENFQ